MKINKKIQIQIQYVSIYNCSRGILLDYAILLHFIDFFSLDDIFNFTLFANLVVFSGKNGGKTLVFDMKNKSISQVRY